MSIAFSNYVKTLEARINALEADAKGGITELTKLIVEIGDKLAELEMKQQELMTTIAETRVIASPEPRPRGRPRKAGDGPRQAATGD